MTEEYYFFNSTATDRRRHQASDMADYWRSFLSTGLISWDGEPLLEVTTEGTNRNVSLSIGRAVMKGHLYLNKAIKDLPIDGPDPTLDRIDRLVLRFDNTLENRYIKSFIIKGEPSADPVPPELERTYLEGEPLIYEISLAQIRVVAGKSFIEQSDIYDERLDETVCGLASSLVSVPTDVFTKEWKEFVAKYNRWFAELQGSAFATVDDVRNSENNMKREIANLNLQIEANKRVKNGVTFGTNFADSFGMDIDMARTSSDVALSVGQTVLNVQDASALEVGTEVTIYDDVNLERVNIASIDGNEITLETALTNGYKEGVNVARSMAIENRAQRFLEFGKWGDRKEYNVEKELSNFSTSYTQYIGAVKGTMALFQNKILVTTADKVIGYDIENDEEFILEEFHSLGSSNGGGPLNRPRVFAIRGNMLMVAGITSNTSYKVCLFNKELDKIDEKEFNMSTNFSYHMGFYLDENERLISLSYSGERRLVVVEVDSSNSLHVLVDKSASGHIHQTIIRDHESQYLTYDFYYTDKGVVFLAVGKEGINDDYYRYVLEVMDLNTLSGVREYSSQSQYSQDGTFSNTSTGLFGRVDGVISAFVGVGGAVSNLRQLNLFEVDLNGNDVSFNEVPNFTDGTSSNTQSFRATNAMYKVSPNEFIGMERSVVKRYKYNYEEQTVEHSEILALDPGPNNLNMPAVIIPSDIDEYNVFYMSYTSLVGSGIFGIGAELTTNDIRFKVKPSKEVVTWLQRDEGLTVTEATFGNINLDLSTLEDETQAVGYTTIEQDEVRLTIERESVDDDVKAHRILGGTS